MVSLGEQRYNFFIGYKDDDYGTKPLHVIFPKPSAYEKICNVETDWIYLFIEDDELLETYNDIWNKVNNTIKKEIDCESITRKTFRKLK